MKDKKWNLLVICSTLFILAAIAGITIFIDPFLHYHAPLEFLEYPLTDERYQSDGIARYYDYDAVITGTSMAQNFKTSEFEQLWGGKAIKVATSGATFHEMNEQIRRVLDYNSDTKYVVCSFDGNWLNYDADYEQYAGIPKYMYDRNPLNDVNYLLNKEVLPKTLAVLNYTRAGNVTPTMDEYVRWSDYMLYGKEAVLRSIVRIERDTMAVGSGLRDVDRQRIRDNVTENFLKTAQMYPDTEFYLFFPPYSAYYWDVLARQGKLEVQIEAEKLATEIMLEAKNVHLFSFSDKTEITFNMDNYTDSMHYGGWINTEILQYMNNGEGRLTKDNYEEYFEKLIEIYNNCELEY